MNTDTRDQVVAAMVAAMPKGTPDPALLALYAYLHFRRAHAFDTVDHGKHSETVLTTDRVHAAMDALRTLEDALLAMLPATPERHRDILLELGLDLERLHKGLGEFGEVAVPARTKDPGRQKDHTTVGALAAGRYLMQHGIRRQRAARLVAVLMANIPGIPAKTWQTIEQDLRDSDPAPQKIVKAKGWGAYR
jgi:hypothetical protein